MLDQLRADAVILRPPWMKPLSSIRVKGHGPAMQDARTLRNSLSGPASSETEAEEAFQLPSGEQGDLWSHGIFAVFTA